MGLTKFIDIIKFVWPIVTFGKSSLLTETLITALVLGGASQLGTLPGGVKGEAGALTAAICVVTVAWVGIQTGQSTLSPLLNKTVVSLIVSVLHFVYISAALFLVFILRNPIGELSTILESQMFRVMSLVSILTLAYILSVNRRTELSESEREARDRLQDILETINDLEDGDSVSDQELRDLKQELSDVAEEIPRSEFADTGRMKDNIESLVDNFDHANYQTLRQIVNGNYKPEDERTDQYNEIIKLYQGSIDDIARIVE